MIQINNLSHLYPNAEKNALSAVNFDIESASTVGLLGPNGAGKTTLMSLLAGLQSVQQGEIYFDGVPFAKLSKTAPSDFLGATGFCILSLAHSLGKSEIFCVIV